MKENPGSFFENLKKEIAVSLSTHRNNLMNVEITLLLGRKPYERSFITQSFNHRNGSYERTFAVKGIGEIKIAIPRDRQGKSRRANLFPLL